MPVLKEHISIPKAIETQNDLDFAFLRKQGIAHIEKLGGALWTDYNSHDPGITILEMLCYAITDLGMRIELPLSDLLTTEDPTTNINKQFYKASEILPNKAVTAADYRKLFIDLLGVKNCWVRKYDKEVYVDCKNSLLSYDSSIWHGIPESKQDSFKLKGLYKLVVEYEDDDPASRPAVNEAILKRYHANRNLCEDLVSIEPVGEHLVQVCADIEVETGADEELIHATIEHQLEAYLAPGLGFYSLQQMLDKNYKTEEIFEGPVLDNGFIDDAELAAADLRSEVRLSDIINIIMDVPGVKVIKEIAMGNCGADNLNAAVLCIAADTKPKLCDKSVFNYSKDVLPLSINPERVAAYKAQMEALEEAQRIDASLNKELGVPQGLFSSPGAYTTMMNDFPDTYGISSIGIPGNPNNKRKAQAKQLKGYMMFFDQILANYFKHLEKINQIMAVNGEETRTFFAQAVQNVEGMEDLVTDYPLSNDDLLTDNLYRTLDNNIARRNAILDHLIARFAERFADYVFVMKSLYGSAADEIVLRNKELFLNDYREVSACRGSAFNYYKQQETALWDTSNVAGIQRRIARLMGVLNYNRRHLTSTYVDIYDLINSDDCKVYRWRIRNNEGEIILSGTEEYADRYLATRELYFAVLQLVQTKDYELIDAFEKGIQDQAVYGNIQVQISPANQYSFNVVNPEVTDQGTKDYIVARQFSYSDTPEELLQELLEVIAFMKYEFTEEGLFVVEHMLLRPDVTEGAENPGPFMPICADQCDSCEPLDPYSYRVSIVIPGFTYRFYNTDFRAYMEQVIRQELPAHVMAKICWIGYREGEIADEENELKNFENKYKKYLFAKTDLLQAQPDPELGELLDAIGNLSNVYPNGRLYDCSEEVEELSEKVILGKTNLGSI